MSNVQRGGKARVRRGPRSRRIAIVLTAAVVITAVPFVRPASAVLADVPIQPGAPMIDPGSFPVASYCTMNFVFKDRVKKNANYYIGTAKSCTNDGPSTRVRSPHVGAFGTVVYRGASNVDFALIKIDRNKLKYVSRVVRGFGAAPTGYTTSRKTSVGDLVVTHGYPYGATNSTQAATRAGVLGNDTPTHYWSSIQPNIQDRGSPVIRADGKAVGMSDETSSFWATWLPEVPPIAKYPTVEGLLRQLRSAGFDVTL